MYYIILHNSIAERKHGVVSVRVTFLCLYVCCYVYGRLLVVSLSLLLLLQLSLLYLSVVWCLQLSCLYISTFILCYHRIVVIISIYS